LGPTWYDLSDGKYDVIVKGRSILTDLQGGGGIGYYVAHLWENILSVAAPALEIVPPEIAFLLERPGEWAAWERRARSLVDDQLDQTLFWEAVGWWGDRRLDASHLAAAPDIHLVSTASDSMTLWVAHGGVESRFVLDRNHVADEIHNFDRGFMDAMAHRIDEASATTPVSQVQQLRSEWSRMAHMLERTLHARQPTDWFAVQAAIAKLEGRLTVQ
jgi:hypothetical protein